MRRARNKRWLIKATALVAPFVVIFVVLVFLAPAIREWSAVAQHGGRPRRISVDRFDILVSEGVPLESLEIAAKLPRYEHEVLRFLGGPLRSETDDIRIELHLFAGVDELTAFTRRTTFKREIDHNDGFYNPLNKSIAIRMTRRPKSDTAAILHEVAHALCDLSAEKAAWSPWFSEGLATWLAESSFEPAFRLGGLDRNLLRVSRRREIPLKTLLAAPPVAYQSEGNEYYYAKAHLLVYYLIEGAEGKNRAKFAEYSRAEAAPGAVGASAFETLFGDIETLEKDLQAFVNSVQ